MSEESHQADSLVALIVIVPENAGSIAREAIFSLGVTGGTLVDGTGTASGKILRFLGLEDTNKDILISLLKASMVRSSLDILRDELEMDEPGNGICFILPVDRCVGSRILQGSTEANEVMNETTHELLITIVDRGFAEDAVDASKRAGATGGTILHGRGCSIKDREMFFGIPIEPEKEIVLTLTAQEKSGSIMDNIVKELELEKPGHGICFSIPVRSSVGFLPRV